MIIILPSSSLFKRSSKTTLVIPPKPSLFLRGGEWHELKFSDIYADHKIRRGGNKLKFSSVHSREIPRSVLMERGGKRRRGRRKFPCNAGIRRRTRDAAGMCKHTHAHHARRSFVQVRCRAGSGSGARPRLRPSPRPRSAAVLRRSISSLAMTAKARWAFASRRKTDVLSTSFVFLR